MMILRQIFHRFLLLASIHLVVIQALSSTSSSSSSNNKLFKNNNNIRAISFDVTGTLITTREPVIQSYYDAAIWSRLPNLPSKDKFKKAFKLAFKERSLESPCFGGVEKISGRDWWLKTVQRVLDNAYGIDDDNGDGNKSYSNNDFERYFRRVYQHFGSPNGYMVLEDANEIVTSLNNNNSNILLGITSNTPTRHMESVLPMLDGFHNNFNWFTCSQDVGYEKPSKQMFDDAFQQAKYWIGDENLQRDQILHIGDSLACDYCGAKAYGFQALLLDRTSQNIPQYQDWIEAPDYPGKSEEDIKCHTITNLLEVNKFL